MAPTETSELELEFEEGDTGRSLFLYEKRVAHARARSVRRNLEYFIAGATWAREKYLKWAQLRLAPNLEADQTVGQARNLSLLSLMLLPISLTDEDSENRHSEPDTEEHEGDGPGTHNPFRIWHGYTPIFGR